jgi:hypothetical protein
LPQTFQTLTDDATIAWTYSLGYNAEVTIAGNRSLSITGMTNGDYGTLIVKQPAVTAGQRINFTGLFPSGTYSFSTAVNEIDVFTFVYDGSQFLWNFNKRFV